MPSRSTSMPKVLNTIKVGKDRPMKDPQNMRARIVGSHFDTITAGQTKNLDWKISRVSWNSSDKQTYFNGVEYYAENARIGDTADFQIVDVDGVQYPAGTVVEEFATNLYIIPNKNNLLQLYKGKLPDGMYIRVKYNSTGTNDVNLVCNLLRHLDEKKDL